MPIFIIMGTKIIITEKQLSKLIDNLNEIAAGYDDYQIMWDHSKTTFGVLTVALDELIEIFKSIATVLNDPDLEYEELRELFYNAVKLIGRVYPHITEVLEDFTDKDLILSGDILSRKLKSYQEKLVKVLNMGYELINKEQLIDKLREYTTDSWKNVKDFANKFDNAEGIIVNRVYKNRPKADEDLN